MAWHFLKTLNTEVSPDPAIPLLAMYPREMEACVHTNPVHVMFIVALFIIAKKWEINNVNQLMNE